MDEAGRLAVPLCYASMPGAEKEHRAAKEIWVTPEKERKIAMKMKHKLLRLFSLVAVLAMVAVMCFSLASCATNEPETPKDSEGAKITIQVTVTHGDGSQKVFDIESTEGATLRSALESIDLVQGDESEFGLYVKTVDGERADYDLDGAYWGFFQDGEYMMEGIDTAKVKDGDSFEIKYSK